MKKNFYNIGYFLKEAKIIFRLNVLSNVLSLFSTGLIFFILAMVISGWWITSQVVEVIQEEAEINVYFDDNIGDAGVVQLLEKIKGIEGVRKARIVEQAEAYNRMVKILGKEAGVLNYFEDNPFSSFIEATINLEKIDPVLEALNHISGISHVRNNREILERLRNISNILRLLGTLVIAAVGISTLVIISHIIRLGIYMNKEQINTLRLLGAPEAFIAFPFLLEGLLLTLGGGILAAALAVTVIKLGYAQMAGALPFIPLPPSETLISGLIISVMSLSGGLGIIGSLLGLSSANND